MRVLSLNVDQRDAAALRRIVVDHLEHCPCGAAGEEDRCPTCAAMGGIASDLARLLVDSPPAEVSARRVRRVGSGTPAAGNPAVDRERREGGWPPLRLLPPVGAEC